jgi:hypothetical protein
MSTLRSLLIGAATALAATGTVSAQGAHPRTEVRQDRRELRRDARDVRQKKAGR